MDTESLSQQPSQNTTPSIQETPQIPSLTNQQVPPLGTQINTGKSKKWLFILFPIIFLLLIITIGIIVQTKNTSSSKEINIPSTSTQSNNNTSATKTVSDCKIYFSRALLPANGAIEPLFMRLSADKTDAGYEAIMRRSVQNDKAVYDVVTNSFPEINSPYYLMVLQVDTKGTVCKQTVLGQLEKISKTGAWGISGLNINADSVNDGEVFVITEKNFGAKESDLINNLDHPSIILLGSYMTNHK